jgi:hypothetical protein
MERNRLEGEKWGINDLKIRFQQFLLGPVRTRYWVVWTRAKNATLCQARPDTCRELNLLPNPFASRMDTPKDTIPLHDPSGHKISLSGRTTQKLILNVS